MTAGASFTSPTCGPVCAAVTGGITFSTGPATSRLMSSRAASSMEDIASHCSTFRLQLRIVDGTGRYAHTGAAESLHESVWTHEWWRRSPTTSRTRNADRHDSLSAAEPGQLRSPRGGQAAVRGQQLDDVLGADRPWKSALLEPAPSSRTVPPGRRARSLGDGHQVSEPASRRIASTTFVVASWSMNVFGS
jgi:hypothetical protein